MLKIITSTSSLEFPEVLCLATYFTLHVSLKFPVILVLLITIDECMALWGEPTYVATVL